MKAKINKWSTESTNLCGVSGSFDNQKSLEYFDLLFTRYQLTTRQINELNSEITVDGAAKEATYSALENLRLILCHVPFLKCLGRLVHSFMYSI